jgi:hypothetical protein
MSWQTPICGAHRGTLSLDSWVLRVAALPRGYLTERERQQTGAQQHEAGCGQREESVGHKIMFTHEAPVTLDALPNSLKVSESVI